MKGALTAVLVGFAGCQCGTSLTPTERGFLVEPRSLDFGEVFVGASGERRFTVSNRSRATLELEATSSGAPFFVEPGTLSLAGGASLEAMVRFEPLAAGPVSGTVQLGEVTVGLRAIGVEPLRCAPSTECLQRLFSAAEGRCVEVAVADGTSCEGANGCLVSARCSQGVCVGQLRDCDDADRCTVDECASGACTHRPLECRPSTNPCEAARCDPVRGCVVEAVDDGVSCGANDCVTAKVCVNGRCVVATPPEGSECEKGSFCRASGRCEEGRCVVPPPTPLQPLWRVEPTVGWVFDAPMGLVGDEQGNVWVRECEGSCFGVLSALRSFTPAGVERLRVLLDAPFVSSLFDRRPLSMVQDGMLLTVTRAELVALELTTAQRRWTVPLHRFFGPETTIAPQWLVGAAPGRVVVGVNSMGPSGLPAMVLSFSTADGGAEWQAGSSFLDSEAAADAQGQVYFAAVAANGYDLRSLDVAGGQRWSVPGRVDMLSVADGRLVTLGGVHSTATGMLDFSLTMAGAPGNCTWTNHVGYPLVPGQLFAYTGSNCGASGASARFVIDLAQRRVTGPIVAMPSSTFLRVPAVSASGAFFGLLNSFNQPRDVLASYQGSTEFLCELDGPSALDALMDRELLVRVSTRQVDAFRVPGLVLPSTGWVTSRGDVTRRGRAR